LFPAPESVTKAALTESVDASPANSCYRGKMDQMKLDHLAQARRHVAIGERHIARQRELVIELERDGHDASSAKQLLVQFEELQALHIADRDRLEQELAAGL
jgi:hypothetical protein